MKSLYSFIIKPLNERYENVKKVEDKELIINSNIEDHRFVSKKAVVVSTPAAYATQINIGDELYVHHNIFRRYYNHQGKEIHRLVGYFPPYTFRAALEYAADKHYKKEPFRDYLSRGEIFSNEKGKINSLPVSMKPPYLLMRNKIKAYIFF